MPICRVLANEPRIRKVLLRIEQDPATTVKELARLVHLSGSRLGHLFKLETGLELRHYLVESRLEKASELLLGTNMQIKEISHLTGYQHVPSFDRVFRKKFKVSPVDYRREPPEVRVEEYAGPVSASTGTRG